MPLRFDDHTGRRVALALGASLLIGGAARADDGRPPAAAPPAAADDARALFDLTPPAPAATEPCDELGFACVFPADPLQPFAPGAITTRLDGDWLRALPTAGATSRGLATYAIAAGDDPRGASVAGASAVEHRWTVDGAPVDDVRTGGPAGVIPIEALGQLAFTTGGFSSRDRASTGALIDARLRPVDRSFQLVGAWLGGGAPGRDVAPARYQPSTVHAQAPGAAALTIVRGAPFALRGIHGWWSVAGEPQLAVSGAIRRGQRLVDRDDDGVPDRGADGLVTEALGDTRTSHFVWDVPFAGHAGATHGPHTLTVTFVARWWRTLAVDPMATASAGDVATDRSTADEIATWQGRWAHTLARVQLGQSRQTARDRAATGDEAPQLDTAFVPAPADAPDAFGLTTGCDDSSASDPYGAIVNCPVSTGYFARGGAGQLDDVAATRTAISASIAHRRGEHRLEVGAAGEDAELVIVRRYTGGYYRRSLFGVDQIDTRLVELGDGFADSCSDDDTVRCRILDRATSRYRTRNGAAWALDTWRPGDGIAVEVGARGEIMQLAGVDLRAILPRVSAAWDPLGGGRSRVFAGWARVMPQLPGRLGELIGGGPAELTTVTIPSGSSKFLDVDRGLLIEDGLAPMIADDVTGGVELALARALHLAVTGHARILRRGLERDGVLLVGPGDSGGVAADRRAAELAVELATAPTAPLALRVGYLYARARGNWDGPADPSRGASFYTSGIFAGTPITGDLSSDLRHRFAAEVVTHRRIHAGELRVSGRAVLASGRPIGAFDSDGNPILARGALGRTPPVTSVNVRVALRRGAVELGVDVGNLFDRRTALTVDERYAEGVVRPIVGGTAADLVFARTDDGVAVAANPGYGRATSYARALTGLIYARYAH